MLLVVEHHIGLKADVSYRVDPLQVLFYRCVEVAEDEDLNLMSVPPGSFCKGLEPRNNDFLVLISVPCHVDHADIYLPEHLCFLFRHDSDVDALCEVHLCLAID